MARGWCVWVWVVAVLVVCPVGAAQGDLIGWWTFDEGAGGTASDSSGRGASMTLHQTRWADGVFGGAVDFQGRGSGDAPRFKSSGNAISVGAWVRHEAFRIGSVERYVTVAPEVAVIRKEGAKWLMTTVPYDQITDKPQTFQSPGGPKVVLVRTGGTVQVRAP